MRLIAALFSALLLFPCLPASAGIGLRLLGTNSYTEAKDMNGFLNGVGLTDIKRFPGAGIELNSGAAGGTPVEFAFRYNRQRLQVGVLGDATESDYTRLTAWSAPFLLRFYLLDMRYIRFDVFGGGGPSWASLETRKGDAQSSYELASGDLRLMTMAAGSVHFGFDYAYLVLEAGYQWNKVDSLTKTWQPAPGAMNTLDLSGPFVTFGFAFRVGGPSGGIFAPGSQTPAPPARAAPAKSVAEPDEEPAEQAEGAKSDPQEKSARPAPRRPTPRAKPNLRPMPGADTPPASARDK